MILQALKEYYDRKAADKASNIAPEGFEKKEFPFLIVIDMEGRFIALEDTREQVGRKSIGKSYVVPRSKSRSGSKSYATTFLLWDHSGYLLGHPAGDTKAANQHAAWLASLDVLPAELRADPGVGAVLKFYATGGVQATKAVPDWLTCSSLPSCNMTFRIAGDPTPVPCRTAVQEHVRQTLVHVAGEDPAEDDQRLVGRCLVTGEIGEIARIHGNTPISKDSKKLMGIQRDSGFDSYGKEQGYNAPVSRSAEFAYVTALNTLLKSTSQRVQIGDASTVFWAARETPLEQQMPDFFGEPPKDDPDRNVRAVASLLRAVESGAFAPEDRENRFYVLGLAPNAARIAVRFWHMDTVAGMSVRIAQHFLDTRLAHSPNDRDHLSLKRLLKSIAAQEDEKHIPPNLAGDTMRAILGGLPYPETLLQAAVRRNRAEQDVPYARAALIKACINRKTRYANPNLKEELHVSLDPTNTNTGYRLGRLFAVLEKIQAEASPGINATIRDRYYGAASGTPVTVFSTLMKLKNHHLAKLENPGRRVNFERLIGQVMDGITDFPANLSLADQGRFAIGYYHQMQDFFTRKSE